LFVNISQIFFGLGAFTGPLLPVFTIKYDLGWEYSYIIAAGLCCINLIIIFFIDISDFDYEVSKNSTTSGNFTSAFRLENKSIFIFLMLLMFFYVCAETGLATWIPTFLRLNKAINEVLAGQVLSLFWFSTIAGRIITGLLSRKIKIANLLTIIIILTIIFLGFGIYFSNAYLVISAFILAGIFIAGIWPLIVSIGGIKYPEKKNFVISIIILCGGLGGLSAPWLLGFILDSFNLFFAMNIILAFLLMALILAIYLAIITARNKIILPKQEFGKDIQDFLK
ncbi:MAG: MFS transporter, partial [Actinobacteria bacterium]|nr:MFS transporter [Actinomycetota bacterium]